MLVWLCVWCEVQIVCIWSSWCHCIPKPRYLLHHLNPHWFYLSGAGLPRLSWKRGHETDVVLLKYISISWCICCCLYSATVRLVRLLCWLGCGKITWPSSLCLNNCSCTTTREHMIYTVECLRRDMYVFVTDLLTVYWNLHNISLPVFCSSDGQIVSQLGLVNQSLVCLIKEAIKWMSCSVPS